MNLTEINCKELFKNAYERRYTWDNEFSGYKGKCILSVDSNTYKGNFSKMSSSTSFFQGIVKLFVNFVI